MAENLSWPPYAVPAAPVVAYVTEEVRRQRHDVTALEGLIRVAWMLEGWCLALLQAPHYTPTIEIVRRLGQCVERNKNASGFRRCGVRVGTTVVNVPPDDIVPCLERLLARWDDLSPLALYREFELIHPFVDGNGRVGKILLNWRAGTLLEPVFPPANFWGERIENP